MSALAPRARRSAQPSSAAMMARSRAACTFDDVVKCTCHLADIGAFDRFNSVYAEVFRNVRPARTTVQSVLWGGIRVEIDAIARSAR